jgi:tetratricopeptide (TPR) repeat protein
MVEKRRTRCSGLVVAFALSFTLLTPARAAQPEPEHAAAVESFRRGTQLVEAGRMQEAIDAFREALRHDPASVGARLDLADCYEKIGAPASAWREYAIAEAHARQANDPRREMARTSGAHLETGLLLVTLTGSRVSGMELRVDGDPVAGEIVDRGVIAVAPGRHRIDLSAPGKKPIAQDVAGGAGETRSVALAFDDDSPRDVTPRDERSGTVSSSSSSAQRTWGVAIGVLGLAGAALGSVAGAIAVSDKSDLEREAHDASVGSTRFYADRSTADTFANVSTAALIAGGVALVAGVGLYLTAPSSSGLPLRAGVGQGAGGSTALIFAGSF